MKNLKFRWIKQASLYGIASILNKAAGIILLPLYSLYIQKEEFGILEIVVITNTLFLLVFQGGIGSAIMRTSALRQEFHHKNIVSTSTWFMLFMGLMGGNILFWGAEFFASLLLADAQYEKLIQLSAFLLLPNLLIAVITAHLRIKEKALTFLLLQSLGFFIEILAIIVFLKLLRLGLEGILLALVLKSWAVAIIGIYLMRQQIRLIFSLRIFLALLRFGSPLVISGIMFYILNMSDRYFLRVWSTFGNLGIYSIGYKLGLIVALLVNAMQMAWPPVMYRIARESKSRDEFKKLTLAYLAVISTFVALISLFAPELLWILTAGKFTEAAIIVPPIALAYLFQGLFYMTNIGLNVTGRTEFEPVVVGLATLTNIGFNILLIPRYDILGAAIATTISYAVLAVSAERTSQYFFPTPQNYRLMGGILALIMAISGASYFFYFEINLLRFAVKLVILFLFSSLLARLANIQIKKKFLTLLATNAKKN